MDYHSWWGRKYLYLSPRQVCGAVSKEADRQFRTRLRPPLSRLRVVRHDLGGGEGSVLAEAAHDPHSPVRHDDVRGVGSGLGQAARQVPLARHHVEGVTVGRLGTRAPPGVARGPNTLHVFRADLQQWKTIFKSSSTSFPP